MTSIIFLTAVLVSFLIGIFAGIGVILIAAQLDAADARDEAMR